MIRAANGTLLAFCEGRKNGGGDSGDIDLLLERSTDGGITWTPPVDAPPLVEPVWQASLIRHAPGRLLVFSNPAAKTRIQLTVRTSADEGRTWRDLAVLHAGPSADSSLVSLADREIGCLYERGEKGRYEQITFARLALP